ncbi:MAG TPA: hypothetical protein VND54_03075 [Candidatus Saccharimonadales bacterium]|nr:hypothetical protein [Candidatus Saccharimonadales bacterium]
MRTGKRPRGESFEKPEALRRGLRRSNRATLLVASAGLVMGSVVAVAGPTAAVAAKAAAVHTTTLGGAGASHLQVSQIQLHGHTSNVFSAATTASVKPATSHQSLPQLGVSRGAKSHTTAPILSFPTVSCAPARTGCDAISTNSRAKTNRYGLAATANGGLYGSDVEPPDQGLCAGNGYVMESTNIGQIRVFNASLQPLTGITPLATVMGLTGLGWSSGGDINCEYDSANGGHWFITEIVSTTTSPFTGCFAAVVDSCREGLAVSTSNNPLATSWNVYFIDPNLLSPTDTGAGYLLNDYGKMGTTRDALMFFYDEFNLAGPYPTCPAFDCVSFNGAQELAIQKSALELGYSFVNLVHENMGTDPSIQPPDGNCFSGAGAGVTCWYQVIPASAPAGEYDNNSGGTGFMAATLDFGSFAFGNGTGDNRAAVFYWTGLSALNSLNCSTCSLISFGGQLFTGLESYTDSGAGCPASAGNPCGMAAQRNGIVDLGTNCATAGLSLSQPCPEEGLATNGDGVTQVSYSAGHLWFAVSTLIDQTFGSSNEVHVGAAYWVVGTGSSHLTLTSQGYVAAAHEDLEFPTMIGGPSSAGTVMSFTLSGDGGPTAADHGGFFPSSAYGVVTPKSAGLVGKTVRVAALGQAPQDGFTEYLSPLRPRWGDYGAGIFVPGKGFYFASEYIQYPNCSPSSWLVDPSCGGTRDTYANFGTSINLVP